MLKRHSSNITVNFDPDTAGEDAAERSIKLLLDESMHVRIMELDEDLDPDEYCKKHGAEERAYEARVKAGEDLFLLAGGSCAGSLSGEDVRVAGRHFPVSAAGDSGTARQTGAGIGGERCRGISGRHARAGAGELSQDGRGAAGKADPGEGAAAEFGPDSAQPAVDQRGSSGTNLTTIV